MEDLDDIIRELNIEKESIENEQKTQEKKNKEEKKQIKFLVEENKNVSQSNLQLIESLKNCVGADLRKGSLNHTNDHF